MRKRITKCQKNMIKFYLNKYNINYINKKLNLNIFFKNNNDNILDIGFGNGNSIIKSAIKYPYYNFFGIDFYLSGIGNLIKNINLYNLTNIKIINYNSKYIVKNMIIKNSILEIKIFFPDPWFKKKHFKRRLIDLKFIKQLLIILKKYGIIYIITDNKEYFNFILKNIYKLNKNYTFITNIFYYNFKFIDTVFENKTILKKNNIYYLSILKL